MRIDVTARSLKLENRNRWRLILPAVALFAVLAWRSVFATDETELALVLSFGGQVKPVVTEAGLHFKRPWHEAVRFDRRVRLSNIEAREKQTQDRERIVAEPVVLWKIAPEQLVRYRGRFANQDAAVAALNDLVWSRLDGELARLRLTGLLTPIAYHGTGELAGPWTRMMRSVAEACQAEAMERYGIELLDVRMRRLFPPHDLAAVYEDRMIQETAREAERMRQQGRERAEEIVAVARQSAHRLISQAEAQSYTVRSQADGETARILAEAHRSDAEYFELITTLATYRQILDDQTTLVLSAGSELFRLLVRGADTPMATSTSAGDLSPATRPQDGSLCEPCPK